MIVRVCACCHMDVRMPHCHALPAMLLVARQMASRLWSGSVGFNGTMGPAQSGALTPRCPERMQVDGPWHFTANTLQPLGSTVLKRRLLAQVLSFSSVQL